MILRTGPEDPTSVHLVQGTCISLLLDRSSHFQTTLYDKCRPQDKAVLRIKSHDYMHIERSRGLGVLLSPGALLQPQPRHQSRSKNNANEQSTSRTGDEGFEDLVKAWKRTWGSPDIDFHRLNVWSDPAAEHQVRGVQWYTSCVQPMTRSLQ